MAESLGQLVDRLSSLEVDRWQARDLLGLSDLDSEDRDRLEALRRLIDRERHAVHRRIHQVWAMREPS